MKHNKTHHLITIPLRFIAAGELYRYASSDTVTSLDRWGR